MKNNKDTTVNNFCTSNCNSYESNQSYGSTGLGLGIPFNHKTKQKQKSINLTMRRKQMCPSNILLYITTLK